MYTLRIIAGKWRSRKFSFPAVAVIRPTPDKLRETIFNWLQFDIQNTKCLDLFAGSGALGLEALSRGAKQVIFVDNNKQATNKLSQNLQMLNCAVATVNCSSAKNFIGHQTSNFDIIFLDPPFNTKLLSNTIDLLITNNCISTTTLLIIETEQEQLDLPLTIVKTARAGQSNIFLAKL